MMKIATTLLACLAAAYAQRIEIGYPTDQTKLTAGQSTVVEIDRPVSILEITFVFYH